MPDSVPNYLTVNPDGTVSASFTGHIAAAGIDLEAAVGVPPSTPVNIIDWKRASDGAVIAQIFGVEQSTGLGDALYAQAISPEQPSRLSQLAIYAERTVDESGITAFSSSAVRPGGHSAQILRDDGASGFVQTRGPTNSFLSWGQINSAGGVGAGTGDVSSARSGVGTYFIALAGGNYYGPHVIVATAFNSGIFCDCSSLGSGNFRIETRVANTNALIDDGFMFIALASVA